MHQIKHAVRALYRQPAFAIPAIVALGLGIGAATTIFSVVDCVLVRPLPYPQPDRLVSVTAIFPDQAELLPSTEFLNWSRLNRSLESFAAQGAGGTGSLIGPDSATAVTFQKVTVGFLGTLRVRPESGRDFTDADGTIGAPDVAIVSHALSSSLGRAINVDGTSYRVIGVLPATFRYLQNLAQLDVLIPIQTASSWLTDRNEMRGWRAIGRLRAGVTVEEARAEFGSMLAAAERDFPRLYKGARLHFIPYRDFLTGGVRVSLILLLSAVGCVLLIGCANVANLLLARGAGRQREMAVRAALGAGRGRLVRHLLTESLVLAMAGGVMGFAICFAAVPAIRAGMAHKLPRIADLTIDARAPICALLLSAATAALFGTVPALRGSRMALSESMKRGAGRAGMWLAAAEVGLALTLLASAGLLLQSLWRMQHHNLGFDTEHVVLADVWLRGTGLAGAPQVPIETALARIPGAVSWTVADGLPPGGGCCAVVIGRPGMPRIETRSRGDLTTVRHVTPGYFATMHIVLKRGRFLTAHDTAGVMINEALARRFFPGEDPVGQSLLRPTRMIVGIVADSRNDGLNAPVMPEALYLFQGGAGRVSVALRSAGDPKLVMRAVQQQLHELDPSIRASVQTMRDAFQEQTAQPRFLGGLFGIFALAAVVLGMVGIYGVMAFAVARRSREIGIRMALGADAARVRRMVLRDAAGPVIAGIALGIAGSAAIGRYLGSVLFDIKPTDPVTFAVVSVTMAAVAFAASLLPARRASQVDPMVVLRAE